MESNSILMAISDKIPSEGLPLLQDKLKNASEEKINSLATLPLKNHILGLVLGLFFGYFGVDRFYKGDKNLGIAKLAVFILGVIGSFFVIGSLFLIVLWVWCIADYFLVWKGIKKDNFDKILKTLD
ncbi:MULTISPECIES: TM2 domain-containing protein [Campylobacter]|uniref:TM2 domain-containing protein n=2 Tax=Campylobacter TaxID=194 RepID=A0ABY2TIN7_9BACT|nr:MULTISPECIES: TM2 domain-containing protein [Campylobacter]MBZ7964971.1 TM2 domain-containing protein [Campylobacter sp. 2457A]TKX30762.1 TM2 domain-containing protein [Campylobacter aviculae]TKX33702.1 TM2 domain-containing protein [Campylobacter taeniopygiae]